MFCSPPELYLWHASPCLSILYGEGEATKISSNVVFLLIIVFAKIRSMGVNAEVQTPMTSKFGNSRVGQSRCLKFFFLTGVS